jgi:isopenicillin-N N-acyltransferase-like protein
VSGMPVVRVEGTAAERGRAAGAALAEPIHRSLAFYRGFLERRGARIGDLPRLLGPYREAAERALPALVAEVDGLAEGAEAPPWEVFAVNAFEELEPLLAPAAAAPLERCTAFAVTGAEGTLLAHNEQWYAGDSGNAAVIIQRPDDGIGFVSPTVVTCLPAVGLNSAGLAQGIMSLTARDDGVGIPRVLVSRCALRAADREDLIRRATIGGRAGGYAHLVAREGGEAFTVETSTTEHAVLEGPDGHTNHYLDPELADRGETSAGSTARLGRLRTLLAERDPRTPQDAMEVLRDHEGEPQAICLHPHPADGDEASSVLFSMVCHLEERRMWVAAGNPCTAPYEEIDIREVA